MINCNNCGKEFEPATKRAVFCNATCRSAANRRLSVAENLKPATQTPQNATQRPADATELSITYEGENGERVTKADGVIRISDPRPHNNELPTPAGWLFEVYAVDKDFRLTKRLVVKRKEQMYTNELIQTLAANDLINK